MNEVEFVKFEDLYLDNSRNGVSKPSRIRGEGFPMVNMKEIFAYDIISNQKMERVPLTEAEHKNTLLKANDLLFARQSLIAEGAGKVSIIANLNEETTFESHIIRVRLDDQKVEPKFYYYYFASPQGKGNTQSIVMQVAAAGVRGSDLAKLKVPYIPLPTQKKIAAILSSYDDLIENNNQRIKLLEEMAEEIYKEWFVRFRFPGYEEAVFLDKEGNKVTHGTKGAIPEEWEKLKLRECLEHYIGGGWGEEFPNGKNTIPAHVIRGTDFPDYNVGKLNFDILRYHTKSNLSSRICEPNDIIFEVSGGTESQSLGRTCFISEIAIKRFKEPVICASFCKLLRVDNSVVSPFYINELLNRMHGTGELKVYQVQSTGISNYQFEDFIEATKINIPPTEVQEKFDNIIASMYDEIQILGEKNQILQETRDLLLPRLISGKLSVEDLEVGEK